MGRQSELNERRLSRKKGGFDGGRLRHSHSKKKSLKRFHKSKSKKSQKFGAFKKKNQNHPLWKDATKAFDDVMGGLKKKSKFGEKSKRARFSKKKSKKSKKHDKWIKEQEAEKARRAKGWYVYMYVYVCMYVCSAL